MKKNIAIIFMLILVIGMGIFVYDDSKKYEKRIIENKIEVTDNSNIVVTNDKNEVEEVKEDNTSTLVEEAKDETSNEEVSTPEPVEDVEPEAEPEPIYLDQEQFDEPVSFFLNESKVISESEKDDLKLKERAKQAFINIIDFIFYDKEIKRYRFRDLTNEAKLKIIEIALDIDSKIDSKFPKYKDSIKEGYENIKGKLGVKFLEVSANICDSMGEEKCNLAKESFSHLKKSLSFSIELVKELAKSGSQRLKEIYEKFRG